MLRSALALLSSLQIGVRLKESFERSLRQAVVIGVAVVILLAALCFGLLAAYNALISLYQFSAVEAACIIAAALTLLGLLVLATLPLFERKTRRRRASAIVNAPAEGLGFIDRGVGKAMQQVGPVTLLVIAFAAGLLASRK
jgi:predicted membrane-bound spermidine synthase